MSGMKAKCIFEFACEGLPNGCTHEEAVKALRETLSGCEYRVADYEVSDIQDFSGKDVVFGFEHPEQICNLASDMQTRCIKRACAYIEKEVEMATNRDHPQLPPVARTVFDIEQALFGGYDFYDAVKALQMARGDANSLCSELCVVTHDQVNFGYTEISSYPSKEDLEYIKKYPENFAYVDVYFRDAYQYT